MPSVDERVVEMKFDNKNFEKNVGSTISILDKLKEKLGFGGASKGLEEVAQAANGFDGSRMSAAVEEISQKFSALGAIGFTVIQDLTRSMIDFVENMASRAIDPILGGGKRRAENIEQAKFMFRGLGMDIEESMESARLAVTGTAFGLDDAAKAAAQMGGSGLRAGEEMTGALRGIAGTAAMTNTHFAEMADIWITAAGNGKVGMYELQRISHRGVNAAAVLAKEWGKTEAQVKEMASNGEISFKMFAEGMDDAFGEHATKANETYSGSLKNLNAAFSRIGATFFTARLEQQRDLFNALTPAVDKVHTAIKPLITAFTNLLGFSNKGLIGLINNLDFSGIQWSMPNFAEAITNMWYTAATIFAQIKKAFRDIFPKDFNKNLLTFSEQFRNLTRMLIPSKDTLNNIGHIFRGIFSVLAIGWEIVKNVAGAFSLFFSSIDFGAGGSLLTYFGDLGHSLLLLKRELVDGGGITEFFQRFLPAIAAAAQKIDIAKIIDGIKLAFQAVGAVVAGVVLFIDALDIPGFVSKIITAFSNLGTAISEFFGGKADGAMNTAANASDRLSERWGWLATVGMALGNALAWVGDKLVAISVKIQDSMGNIVEMFTTQNFEAVTDVANVGILAAMYFGLKKFFEDINNLNFDGWTEKIQGMIDGVTDTLAAMQMQLRAEAIMNIAIAVGVLAASLFVLSMIDSANLAKALVATAIGFAQLAATLAILMNLEFGPKSAAKINLLGSALILLGAALLIFTLAVKLMSTMSLEEVAIGLGGIAAALGIMMLAVKFMPEADGLIRTSIALSGMAIALLLLTLPIKLLGSMDIEQLVQGLAGIAIALAVIVTAVNLLPNDKGLVQTSAALIGMALALILLTVPIKQLGGMDIEQLVQGLAGIAIALALITTAVNFMPPNMAATGVGLVGIGIGLAVISAAIVVLGGMDIEQLIQGLAGMAMVLGLLIIATNAMSGAIMGAFAIVVVSGALVVLSMAVAMFAGVGWGGLIVALVGIAAVLLIFAAAAFLLQPLIPVMFGLGAAMVAFGIGLALIGGAIFLVGAGLYMIVRAFQAMADLSLDSLDGLMLLFDLVISKSLELGEAIFDTLMRIAQKFVDALPEFFVGVSAAITVLLGELMKRLPEIEVFVTELIHTILRVIRDTGPDLILTGFFIIQSLLDGIDQNIEEITNKAIDILLRFTQTITDRMGEIVQMGANLIISFLLGLQAQVPMIGLAAILLVITILDTIGQYIWAIIAKGAEIVVKIIEGIDSKIQDIINAGTNLVSNIITGLSNAVTRLVGEGAHAIVVFLLGVASKTQDIIDGGVTMVEDIMTGIAKGALRLADSAATVLIKFLNELSKVIDTRGGEIRAAGRKVAGSIIDGLTGGLRDKAGEVTGVLGNIAGGAIDGVKSRFGIKSPSRVFRDIGRGVIEGLALGLNDNAQATNSAESLATNVKDAFQKSFEDIYNSVDSMPEFQPTITPVLDLSSVAQEAGKLGSMIGRPEIGIDASLMQAKLISAESERDYDTKDETSTGPTEIKFEQTINAPKALRTGDIYRQTRSQLILAKEQLTK